MDKKRIRQQAGELLGFGYSKQQVFDSMMMEHPEAKPKRVAEIIRYMPTLLGRARYRKLHQLLLALILLYGFLRVLRPLLEPDFVWEISYRLVSLAPIATLLLGYSIYRWQGQVFVWVGWINVLGAAVMINAIASLGNGTGDAWNAALSTLSVGMGVLALFLSNRVFPKYTKEKDATRQFPPRYVFPPDPGMSMM